MYPQGKNFLLRIYIDAPSGVSVDDCGKVSAEISAILDVENPIAGSYILEVSSPGIERSLLKKEHYQRFIGSTVKLHLFAPHAGSRNFKGQIQAVEDDVLHILVNDAILLIPIANIAKAHLVAKF